MSEDTTERLPTTRPGGAQGEGALTRRPTIGLALGGGGARGLAHILMLELFDELGIRPKVIAGTSIGAVFGAAYASGYSAAAIRAHTEELLRSRFEILRQFFSARQEPLGRVLNVLQLRSALLNAESLLNIMMPPRLATQFEDLVIPLRVVAADFYTQDQVVLTSGALQPAIAASMALPALFAPVTSDEYALMDGGLVNPLPFDIISGQADIIVAINVSGAGRLPNDRAPPKAMESLVASLQILQHTIVREKLLSRKPDVLVDVDVGNFHVLEFHKLDKVLEAAAPAKQELRLKLERILSAETLETDDAPKAELEAPARDKRASLANRLLGRSD